MARGLSRVIPLVTPRTFMGNNTVPNPSLPGTAPNNTIMVEFDCLEGFADFNLFNNTLAYPGVNTPKLHAVGPELDMAVWADATAGHVAGNVATVLTEYAIDRGCLYRAPVVATVINGNVFTNISGLRITGRFVRVRLTNTLGAGVFLDYEFGVYVRSA
jgi:hypothetical protein